MTKGDPLPTFGKAGLTITERRKQIVHWLALGKDNNTIAAIMGVSPLTIKNHILHLSLAYGVGGIGGNRLKIVMAALVRGDIKLDDFRADYEKCLATGRMLKDAGIP
jgi:DNA-binding NarL/FixJ family response regulator